MGPLTTRLAGATTTSLARPRCARARHAVRRVDPGALLRSTGYAIGTIAAAAFAAVLYTVVTGDSITGALDAIVQRALSVNF